MSNNGGNPSNPSIPTFKGEKYHLWSLKMKTLFKSQELWDLVEHGYTEPVPVPTVPDQTLRDTRKKDAKALSLIQMALDDDILPRISAATTAHEAWEILKQEYLRDKKVIKAPQFRYDEDSDEDEEDDVPPPPRRMNHRNPTNYVYSGGNRNESGTQTIGGAKVGNSYHSGEDKRQIVNNRGKDFRHMTCFTQPPS